ncbi:MAG: MBL fold metallo-hydrolase [Chlorobiaceae bacterium]|jgi:hydroxyacylglutathione hydrolase|nr:MBL fold metallo-hydrolase [Chlorobiaceae bacterium]
MIVKQFQMGGDRNFGYLVADEATGVALVIDASFDPLSIVRYAEENGLSIRYVFSTHGHADHTNGNAKISHLTGIRPLLMGDICPQSGIKVEDGAVFHLGTLEIRIIHTPGHTDDSICLLAGDAVFTGDTLFTGKIGGTYTEEQARAEYDSLLFKLMTLPPETKVYPGHDYGVSPVSSIGKECSSNPFLTVRDFSEFLHLKQNWAAYKKAHGIV